MKKPEYSGFVIVRLTRELYLPEGNDFYELAKKHGLKGLTYFFEKHREITTRRLIKSLPAEKILELEERASKMEFSPLHSLTSYWRLDCRGLPEIEEILADLNKLPEVDLAYLEMSVSEPSVNAADDTYSGNQDYLDAEPVGIDARWAWTQPNSNGAGVAFIDLEQGWFLNHEDLPSPTLIFNDNRDGVGTYKGNHGTAVLGEVVGVDNNLGIVGIAPGASPVKVTSHYESSSNTNLHVADAIGAAINDLSPGDVLLLEVQRNYLPTETDAGDLDAIRLAVALGIIVVEAAGNGNDDLDAWTNPSGDNVLNRNSPDFIDSGAIMVGASVSTVPHNKNPFSNYGSRIDCYAWGENIVTAGYGDLDPGTGDNSTYTDTFRNTSGAAPIIAGAALILQGMYEAATGTIIPPTQMQNLLSDPATGTPQGAAVAGDIGVMPDLRQIIPLLGLVPDVYLRDNVGDTGVVPSTGGISASPDIIVRPIAVADPEASFGEGSGNENVSTLGYEVEAGQDNYIYARIKNRGGMQAIGVTVDVYWSEVSTLVTPDQWHLIGITNPVNIPATDTLVVTDPIAWQSALIPATGHYCFIGIVNHVDDPAPLIPPSTNFNWNEFTDYIRNNNNIVWRNFNVIDVVPDPSAEPAKLAFIVAGAPDMGRYFDLEIIQRIPRDVEVWLEIPQSLFAFLPKLQFPKIKLARKEKIARVKLPKLHRILLRRVRLGRSILHKCRFLVKGSKNMNRACHSIAIRQIYNNEEVGRVTWALRPPKFRKLVKEK